jgi:hypothetical protein
MGIVGREGSVTETEGRMGWGRMDDEEDEEEVGPVSVGVCHQLLVTAMDDAEAAVPADDDDDDAPPAPDEAPAAPDAPLLDGKRPGVCGRKERLGRRSAEGRLPQGRCASSGRPGEYARCGL